MRSGDDQDTMRAAWGHGLIDLAAKITGMGHGMATKTILFVHGMYMTPLCWEGWTARFEAKGFRCHAPAWPGHDGPVAELRKRHPDPQLSRVTLHDLVNRMGNTIRGLPEPPFVIGHSMGGLVTQLLVNWRLAVAGVAISSAPPAGVISLKWSFLRSNFPHANPFARQGVPIAMTFPRFQYTFVNGMPLEAQRAAFERYVVPESRRVPKQSIASFAKIDFHQSHAPLLLVAGENDHIIPASLSRTNYELYRASSSKVDYREFPGRTHFILGQPGWEEVADHALAWLQGTGL
jgi:pimeloyl-ACP methyl ester carboxylesterase